MEDELQSDLSEVDSGDEYNSKSKKKSSEYTLTQALKVPRATTYTALALYTQIHNNDINLDPEYQRDVVWTVDKQIGLIDSILRNYYIPPIIFATKTFDDGSENKTAIDGKQRLTSIQRFMDGLIPHKDANTGEKLWYKNSSTASKGRTLLPEKYRQLFANKQIVCVEYQDLTDAAERDIFQRVQLGMALTVSEKMQVVNTLRSRFIRTLLLSFVTEDTLAGDAIKWERSRGADFRVVSQAVFLIEKPLDSLKNLGDLGHLNKWLADNAEVPAPFQKKVKTAFGHFVTLLEPKYSRAFSSHPKVAPIEMIAIILLIATLQESCTVSQMCDAIGAMRRKIRDTHQDIRMNSRVGASFIKAIQDAHSQYSEPEQRKRKYVSEIPPNSNKRSASATISSNSRGGNRY
ncbi:hypothetical protein C8J56DRAFT_927181 [Mycena floridula]|nr:hypothetical protein C8J56DRAFT_927181 [Mycena floridula]